jgi:salicylate hydroxylase
VRVLIAGGGTGGLAAAIALRKAGIEPLVLEQAPEFTAADGGARRRRRAARPG